MRVCASVCVRARGVCVYVCMCICMRVCMCVCVLLPFCSNTPINKMKIKKKTFTATTYLYKGIHSCLSLLQIHILQNNFIVR